MKTGILRSKVGKMIDVNKKVLSMTVVLCTLFSCSSDNSQRNPRQALTYESLEIEAKRVCLEPDVYVAGSEEGVAILWKNGIELYKLGKNIVANSVFVVDNDVYVAGVGGFEYDIYYSGSERLSSLKKSNAMLWKNGVLQNLIVGDHISYANSVFVYGNDVYVAGYESIPTGEYNRIHRSDVLTPDYWRIAKLWKNGIAQNLSSEKFNRLTSTWGVAANSIYISENDVYVSGIKDGIATLWKNGMAQSLMNERDEPFYAFVTSVFVSDNDVYVAVMEEWGISLWKNGKTQNIDDIGWEYDNCSVFVSGKDVYIAGTSSDHEDGSTYAWLWKNGTVQDLTNWYDESLGRASSLFVSGNDVYVVGSKLWKNGEIQKLPDGRDHPGGNSIFVVERK